MASDQFSPKLELVLKALSLSRGRLASDLGVDKSLVSRWLSGANAPSGHNLANLTALIASRRPGFNGLDWDRSLESLAGLFGAVTLPGGATPDAPLALPFDAIAHARLETGRRGRAYEGLWRVTHPSFVQPGRFARLHALITRQDGMLHVRAGSAGFEWTGWILIVHNQLHVIIEYLRDSSIGVMLLNGVHDAHAVEMDGVAMATASDRGKTPTAVRVLLQRAAYPSGDPDADRALFERAKAFPALLEAGEVGEDVRAHLLDEAASDGEAMTAPTYLQVPWTRSRSRGSAMADVVAPVD